MARPFGATGLEIDDRDAAISERVNAIASLLQGAGIACHVTKRIREVVWAKLAANLAAGPVSLLTHATIADSLDEAAVCVDTFKAKNCGSAYTLAVLNLNMFGSSDEFNFMMQASVLGDPRMIFIASLKSMANSSLSRRTTNSKRAISTSSSRAPAMRWR